MEFIEALRLEESLGVQMIPPQVLIIRLQERIKHLELGLKHIHAESEAYVLNKNGYKSAGVYKMFGRLAKKYLREE